MIDLKLARKNPEIVDKSLISRGLEPISHQIIKLDKEASELMLKLEEIRRDKNSSAKEIGYLKSQNKDISGILSDMENNKELEAKLKINFEQKQQELTQLCLRIPNILAEDVPLGANESDNKIIKTVLTPPEFSFSPKPHEELGVNLGQMDFDSAASISGSRFVVLKGQLAKLERALGNFMLDMHIKEHGFLECGVPVLVNESALLGTGQLPKFAEDMFKVSNDKWLISTSEIYLANLVNNKIINTNQLPLRFAAFTNCFRSEAGSGGRDTKGMLRQHQFAKVELVSVTSADNSEFEFNYLLGAAEKVLQALNLPYRVVHLCSGDTGFAASKTYDLEVWLPSQNTYREVSSCSLCGDFQARRMMARHRDLKQSKTTELVHTLNCSGVAVGRALIAVMEANQNEDGSINIPEVLIPYMFGENKINKPLTYKS